MHTRWVWFTLVLLIVLLAACGGDNDGGSTALEPVDLPDTPTPTAAENTSSLSTLPEPVQDALTLPAADDLDGALLFVRGEDLYLGRFDGEPATLLAEGVAPIGIEPSPDRRAVAYSAPVENELGSSGITRTQYNLRVTDLAILEHTDYQPQGRSSSTANLIVGWSPGTAAPLTWNQQTGLVQAGDGQSIGGLTQAAWLTDGSILFFGARPGTENDRPPTPAVFRFDPATGEHTALDVEVGEFPLMIDFMYLEGALYQAGYVYDDTFHDYHRAALLPDGTRVYLDLPLSFKTSALEICDTWEIHQRPRESSEPDTIYSADNITALTDLTALPDGSLLFLRWAMTDCAFTGTMQVELLRLVLGEEPTIIASPVDPGFNSNPNEIRTIEIQRGRKYTVTPDGRYVFWIGGGFMLDGSSTIHVTDLETGESHALLTTRWSVSGTDGFENVCWVLAD